MAQSPDLDLKCQQILMNCSNFVKKSEPNSSAATRATDSHIQNDNFKLLLLKVVLQAIES